jgi:hypothetical protein
VLTLMLIDTWMFLLSKYASVETFLTTDQRLS